ncbi:hypothetical protein EMIHUDRAFT_116350 [Emiliania huxleyi CCMP1516]|uniref:CRAL-TRIO domain-containing protein n=2 Tax=Emiliania huxleyi TaxID=2903 RepID=A0A0D3JJC9_EMIH1|nr:hypothetical protein EMIHUDRAFT_116350 [Emiliania huxleyi CCMP1516]EOD23614.1 hypothetical protein EMIHUDRAFT_116350 [Emiliania huxleyi CCMP1516]|eukprot:XP_005776043.1 hypothetical protein EMIHUDRAFT_116350 [Emiliania huxleyi CCMP1516]
MGAACSCSSRQEGSPDDTPTPSPPLSTAIASPAEPVPSEHETVHEAQPDVESAEGHGETASSASAAEAAEPATDVMTARGMVPAAAAPEPACAAAPEPPPEPPTVLEWLQSFRALNCIPGFATPAPCLDRCSKRDSGAATDAAAAERDLPAETAPPPAAPAAAPCEGTGEPVLVLPPREEQLLSTRSESERESPPGARRSEVKGFVPREEWLPFSEPELQVLATVRRWLGAARFDAVPLDLLVCFVRGYAYRKDWAETVLDSPPADRPLFEQLYQSGPVGRDKQGHIVELMRLGRLKVSKLFKSFELDAIITQAPGRRRGVIRGEAVTYAAEAKRACNIANCGALGKRTYKTVVVIDCAGSLNSDHLTKEFRVLLKKTAEVLSGHYPETMHKTYIINGPLIVRAAWNVSRHMMHPISAAKFSILGSDWKKVFDRDGVVLDGNALPASISWSEAVGELADGGAARRRGWAPPADLANLAALAAVAE